MRLGNCKEEAEALQLYLNFFKTECVFPYAEAMTLISQAGKGGCGFLLLKGLGLPGCLRLL